MKLTTEEKALREEAKPLISTLALMKANWPSEPSLRCLTPRMVDALITSIATDDKSIAPLKWISLIPCLLFLPLIYTNTFLTSYVVVAYCMCWWMTFVGAKAMPRPAVHALTQTDDIRVLPTLVLATRHDGAQNVYVYNAIFRLLGQVTEEHTGLLNNDAQQHLWTIMMTRHIVTEYSDRELTLRTLRALARVGNNATLARVVRLAYSYKYNGSERYLIDEARNLIPIMEARLERQQVPETLLRAADVPASAPDTLLRSAFTAAPEPAEQLLRASKSEGE